MGRITEKKALPGKDSKKEIAEEGQIQLTFMNGMILEKE
jgi:hypothetical protein